MSFAHLKPQQPVKSLKSQPRKIIETMNGHWQFYENADGSSFKKYQSDSHLFGLPLVSIAIGKDPNTGSLGLAHGIVAIGPKARGGIAIGQFCDGYISIGQFCFGRLFAVGQAVVAPIGLGQFAIGIIAIGQLGAAAGGVFQMGAAITGFGQAVASIFPMF